MQKIIINAGTIGQNITGTTVNVYGTNPKVMENEHIKIFLSYSHQDEDIKNELEGRLNNQNKVVVWSDKNITPGGEWDKEIRRELETAHIILLLISPDFISSGYIQNIELKRALEKRELDLLTIIPVFCRFYEDDDKLFLKYQGLPRNRRFIKTLNVIDTILVNETIEGIKEVIDKLLKE